MAEKTISNRTQSPSGAQAILGLAAILAGGAVLAWLAYVATSSDIRMQNLAMGLGLAAPLLISLAGQLLILIGAVMVARGGGVRRPILKGLLLGVGVTAALLVAVAACRRPFNPHLIPPNVAPAAAQQQTN